MLSDFHHRPPTPPPPNVYISLLCVLKVASRKTKLGETNIPLPAFFKDSEQAWTHAVCVAGLPQSGSWQDLKDHMREAGDVCYADVFRDGTGVVEFVRKEDMTYAVRKLDNTKFRSHEVCRLVWFVMDCVFFAVSR